MRGCVTKKGERWYVVFYDRTTKKYRWSISFATKTEAEYHANKTANPLIDGGRLPDAKLTVETYLGQWLDMWISRGKIKETTHARYEDLIRLHILPAFGAVPIRRLTPLMVDKFYTDKQEEGKISNTTIRQIHAVLHKAFREAMKKEVVARNILDLVTVPEIADTIPKDAPWDFEMAKLFLGEARRTSKWYVLYLFTLCTASRESEVVGLQRPDLDLLLEEVHFRRMMYRLYRKDLEQKIIEGTPKSKYGIRDIPLIPPLVDELRKHLAAQDTLRAEFGNTYSQDGNGQLVFCQPNGKYLHIRYIIEHDFKKVCERAKVPIIRFHDLKHCTASFLRALGVDGHTVSAICGHHSPAFTDKHYVHTVNGTMRDAMKRLEGALSLTQLESL